MFAYQYFSLIDTNVMYSIASWVYQNVNIVIIYFAISLVF